MARLFRIASKYYMGRMPAILDLDFVLRAFGVYAALTFGIPILAVDLGMASSVSKIYELISLSLITFALVLVGFAVLLIWIIFVIIVNWTRDLERVATFLIRTSAVTRGIVFSSILIVIWTTAGVILGGVINGIISKGMVTTEDKLLGPIIFGISVAGFIYLIVNAFRGSTAIFDEKRYVEGTLRIGFSIAILATTVIYSIIGIGL